MKPFIRSCVAMFVLLSSFTAEVQAQCTNANVNWDNLDFLVTTGSYSPWVTATMQQNQRFAIGRSGLSITHNYSAANSLGENTTHTGEAGSNATGADVEFRGNGTITITFDAPVTNVLFSLYDVDRSQRVDVDAFDGATGRNVQLGVTSGTILTVFDNNSTTAYATASNQTRAVNSTHATLNVSIAGPVTSVVITVSATGTCSSSCGAGGTENGQFWLSDIQACVTGSFPNNYYTVSQPFTGQPSWVLAVHDLNTVYMVNPANGRAVSIFTDSDPRVREINNLAYDPYKRIIYYSVDGLERCTPAGLPDSIRHIKKYDVNTETISIIVSNVNNAPLRIPTFHSGLESGAAAFYNGSLYMGVEGYLLTGTRNSARETIIWRIDFASDSITPVSACQVWAIPTDNGTNNVHDYADIIIKDGILYNLNSSINATGGSGRGLFYHVNMQTNVTTTTVNPNASADRPAQAAQAWNGTLYWVGADIGTYNGTNASTVTGRQLITNAPRSVTWVGPAGDAAEAYRPKADFGDAPASYDPVALSPALHERDTALRIGNYGWEWSKHTSSNAAGDPDEDGITVVPLLSTGGGGYLVPVRVWNNTGGTARLIGWIDYNGNGVFDAGEASATATVNSVATLQTVNLTWASTPNSFNVGDYTFLRVRLTTSAMTGSNPTGYFPDGEVEDYRVWVGEYPLDVKMISFEAKGMNNKTAYLKWQTTAEENFDRFEVERSTDGSHWAGVGVVKSKGTGTTSINNYSFTDLQPFRGQTFYRLKLVDANGQFQYSEIRTVTFKDFAEQFTISPNPARDKAVVTMQANSNFAATLRVIDFTGRTVRTQPVQLNAGMNQIEIANAASLQNGMYVVQLVSGEMKISGKLLINH